ncbi:MAG: TRAM domain-containing protein [Halieaceae bacterium]|jgi:23S rRNA (uracil1939-C5)-methyltransferase|nr:TRAM domain-containing protein [Halieaceae bacterium]
MAKSPPTRLRFQKPVKRSGQSKLWGKDELLIERMSREGRGIATRAGKIVFVAGALRGERVQVQCTAVKRDYDEARMLGLASGSKASPERVEPACPLYQDCGGCTLQHWSLAAQQRHKAAELLRLLLPLSPGFELDTPLASPASGYRHRLRLVVLRKPDKRHALGLRRLASREAVVVSDCAIANAAVNTLLKTLPALLDEAPQLQGLREIEIDADSHGQLGICCYFAARPGDRALASLTSAVKVAAVTALRARLIEPRKARGEGSLDDRDEEVAPWQELYAEGELQLSITLPTREQAGPEQGKSLELAYRPGDFTQTHWGINEALVQRALEWLQPARDEVALDLFSGIGNFTLPLASRAGLVHALEGDPDMSARVAGNAARNGMDNIRAQTMNLMAENLALPQADIALVDPPRAGAKAVCEAIAGSGVTRLVYVSCHPATLARDARILSQAGFALRRAAAVDMFPHTGHSEAIALFERKLKARA